MFKIYGCYKTFFNDFVKVLLGFKEKVKENISLHLKEKNNLCSNKIPRELQLEFRDFAVFLLLKTCYRYILLFLEFGIKFKE